MPFLALNGTEVPVRQGTGRELPPELAGSERPRYDNTLGSTERSPRRVFTCEAFFPPNDPALADLRILISEPGAIGVPAEITATSDADGLTRGSTLIVRARLGDIRNITTVVDGVQTSYWIAPLTLRETGATLGVI